MKEPQKFSMSTGLPVDKDAEVKHYSLSSDDGGAEASFLKFIADQEESRKKYKERLDKIRNETKDSA